MGYLTAPFSRMDHERGRAIAALATIFAYAALAWIAIAIFGCASPSTKVSVNPITRTISFSDSKDNNLDVEGLEYDGSTRNFKLAKLSLRNNASDVRVANVQQIDAITRQIEAEGQILQALAPVITQAIQSIMPYLPRPATTTTAIELPGIGGFSRSVVPAPVPTSQPGQ